MSAEKIIHIGADNTVEYAPARKSVSGVLQYINDGTCSYELRTADDATVFAALANISMPENGESLGKYIGIIDSTKTALMTAGQTFYLHITFTAPGGIEDYRRICCVAQYRGTV